MDSDLEEGTALRVGWGKTQEAARSSQPVVPVVVQDADTREVLIVGYANDQALAETRRTGTAVLWSTSRDELWAKGATSGDVLTLVEVRVNCEQNSLLYLVRPVRGGACHTVGADGRTRPSCYYRRLSADGRLEPVAAT